MPESRRQIPPELLFKEHFAEYHSDSESEKARDAASEQEPCDEPADMGPVYADVPCPANPIADDVAMDDAVMLDEVDVADFSVHEVSFSTNLAHSLIQSTMRHTRTSHCVHSNID